MNIEVITFAQTGFNLYCEVLHYSMEKLKSNNHNIKYVCYTQDINFKLSNFEVNVVKRIRPRRNKHANLISYGLQHISKDTDIVIIVDCDIAIFYKDWDQCIIDELKNVDIFGVNYGVYNSCYRKFPSAFFMGLNKKLVESIKNKDIFKAQFEVKEYFDERYNMNFKFLKSGSKCGKDIGRLKIDDEEKSKIFSREVGHLMGCDICWELPIYCYQNGFKSKSINKAIRIKKGGNNERNIIFDEIGSLRKTVVEWKYKGQTFLVHLSRSRKKRITDLKWEQGCKNYIDNNLLFIRQMKQNDLEFFLRLRNSCIKFLHNKKIFTMEECQQWFKIKTKYFIIELGGFPIGYIRTSNEKENSIYIGADILSEYRRQGIATWALTEIMKILKKEKYYLEVLETNPVAKYLYDKLGFKELSRNNGSILMVKEI